MRRRTFILALGGAAGAARLRADAQQQVFDLFTRIASALSEDDPTIFLESVDQDMPHFQDFQNDLQALTGQAQLSNSIEAVSEEGDEAHRTEALDWFLEIVGKSESRPVERRRAVVNFRLERRGKRWKIVSIDPLHFFAPPQPK
jgi:hypothetical protein